MHVEVDDGHAREAARERVRGRHGRVVDQAEPTGLVPAAVVAGGPHQRGSPTDSALHHGVDGGHRRPGGHLRDVPGLRRGERVGVQHHCPPGRRFQRSHESCTVHAEDGVQGGRLRLSEQPPTLPPLRGDSRHHVLPLGPLEVARRRRMLAEPRAIDDKQ